MIPIKEAIVVEGKYDRMRVGALFDTLVIETEGFNFLHSGEVSSLIRKVALETGIVILTDSDPAGLKIRSRIIEMLPQGAVYYNAYVPSVEGKEPRKRRAGSAGLLGVEGVSDDLIIAAVTAAVQPAGDGRESVRITMADLYAAGLSGRADSAARREAYLTGRGLPRDMSAKQLIRYLNATGQSL